MLEVITAVATVTIAVCAVVRLPIARMARPRVKSEPAAKSRWHTLANRVSWAALLAALLLGIASVVVLVFGVTENRVGSDLALVLLSTLFLSTVVGMNAYIVELKLDIVALRERIELNDTGPQ